MVSRERADSVEPDRAKLRPIAAGGGSGGGFRTVRLGGLAFRRATLGGGGAFFLAVGVWARLWAFALEAKAPATTAVVTRSFRACMFSHHPENRKAREAGILDCP
jgi:hypothetical protein